jgi:hypothetical protein
MSTTVPTPVDLSTKARAIALEVAARDDSAPGAVERRASPATEFTVGWHMILLRKIFEQAIAVYDPLGEAEIEVDRTGKVWSLDDPRHEPRGSTIHKSEVEAVAAVLELAGATGKEIDLDAHVIRTRDGRAYLHVVNRKPREEMKSKFFQRRDDDKEPEGPLPDIIEAHVNAETGHVYRFRRAPAPPREEAAK